MNNIKQFLKDVIYNSEVPFDVRDKALQTYVALCIEEKSAVVVGTSTVKLGSYEISLNDYNILQKQILGNQKIAAIKHFRSITDAGLKEAKEIIENPNFFKQIVYVASIEHGGAGDCRPTYSRTMYGTCKRCSSPLDVKGFCTSEVCPFDKHKQTCKNGWYGHPISQHLEYVQCDCNG